MTFHLCGTGTRLRSIPRHLQEKLFRETTEGEHVVAAVAIRGERNRLVYYTQHLVHLGKIIIVSCLWVMFWNGIIAVNWLDGWITLCIIHLCDAANKVRK